MINKLRMRPGMFSSGLIFLTMAVGIVRVDGQTWDLGTRLGDSVSESTKGKFKVSFEQRVRYESREGVNFGRDPDLVNGLVRTRFGAAWKPVKWLKLSAAAQDSRSPWYGANAPSSARDQLDLLESYVELFGDRKTGFGMTAGRMMLNYGEGRLVASPQWGNVTRSWDHGRACPQVVSVHHARKRSRVSPRISKDSRASLWIARGDQIAEIASRLPPHGTRPQHLPARMSHAPTCAPQRPFRCVLTSVVH